MIAAPLHGALAVLVVGCASEGGGADSGNVGDVAAPIGGARPGPSSAGGEATSRGGTGGFSGTAGVGVGGGGGGLGDAGDQVDPAIDAGVDMGTDAGDVICPLPSSFAWTSTGPLAEPMSPPGHDFVSLKDFTIARVGDEYAIYATAFDTASSWTGVYIGFSDWAQLGSAEQVWLGKGAVAPQLMYFAPKDLWVLTYQWGFQYATSNDPTDPGSWSAGNSLLANDPTTGQGGTGPIDQTVICDDTDCYLFFAGDNGRIYRGSMPVVDFPGAFTATQIMQDTTANLFEGVEVYSVKGSDQYLMLVEAMGGGGRYFRAFTSEDLGGTFTPMPQASIEGAPFAGKANVTFEGGAWTNDISHGDLVREDPSERKAVDACKLQFLYQGRNPAVNVDYALLPYRPGLLTMVQTP